MLLGYIPATVRYERLDAQDVVPRRSVTLFYLKTNEGPDRRLHAPSRHRPMVERILARGGLAGTVDTGPEVALSSAPTRLDVQVRRDHNQAAMVVVEAGDDFAARVGAELRDLCLHHLDCIYVDLPLGSPASAAAGTELDTLGFRFGGIFPNRSVDGHVLRLQYLNNVAVRRSDVVVVSDLGRELLAYVCPSTGD